MKFNLNKFKKVSTDEKSTVLEHPSGHSIRIAHGALSPQMKKDLAALPMATPPKTPMAEGGAVAEPLDVDTSTMPEINAAIQDPEAIKEAELETQAAKSPYTDLSAGIPGLQGLVPDKAPAPVDNTIQYAPPPAPTTVPTPEPTKTPAPTPEAPTPSDTFGYGAQSKAFGEGADLYKKGLEQQYTAEVARAHAQQDVLKAAQDKQAANQADFQGHLTSLNKERESFINDINNKHIDPNHYMSSLSTGDRITTAIGLILGGMGAGITHTENPALKFLNQQIDNDVRAQQMELGKKENLLSANLRQFGNMRDASEMTRLMLSDTVANQMNIAAAKTTDVAAQSRLNQAMGTFMMDKAPLAGQIAMRKSLVSGVAAGRVGPEDYIRGIVPEKEQDETIKQLKAYQDATALRDNTLGDFEKLAKLNTVANRVGSPIQSTKEIAAIKGAALDKLTKDISGRVTPETVKLIGGMFDTFGGNEKTLRIQKQKINELLSQGMNFPQLKKWHVPTEEGRFDQQGDSVFKLGAVK